MRRCRTSTRSGDGRLGKAAGMTARRHVPDPPVALPPARTVQIPGRGELFVRDTGGDGPPRVPAGGRGGGAGSRPPPPARPPPPLLLLHGWTATADLNWYAQYDVLAAAGHRVVGLYHRGTGRGSRATEEAPL